MMKQGTVTGLRFRRSADAAHTTCPILTIAVAGESPEKHTGKRTLTNEERDIYQRGMVSVVEARRQVIDELVADAYGWERDIDDEDVLVNLVALNRDRVLEENDGLIRYLRPEFQAPKYIPPLAKTLDLRTLEVAEPIQRLAWPQSLPEQVTAVAGVLSASSEPLRPADVAHAFKGRRSGNIMPILDALAAMGQARKLRDGRYAA